MKTITSPTPWTKDKDFPIIIDKNSNAIIDCRNLSEPKFDEINEANAALIVRAVNCHDELIKRFESLLEDQENYLRRITDQDDGDYYTKKSELEKDRKLLKRAKGEA